MNSLTKSCNSACIELKENIVHVQFIDQSTIDIYEAKNIAKIIIEVCNKTPSYFIIDVLNKYVSMSNEARDYFANDTTFVNIHKAAAILVNKTHTELLANFFLKFHKPKFPTKLFNKYDDAIEWIHSLD